MRGSDRMLTAVSIAALGALAPCCAARPATPRRADGDPRDGATFGAPVWLSNDDRVDASTAPMDGAPADGGVGDLENASTLDRAAIALDGGDARARSPLVVDRAMIVALERYCSSRLAPPPSAPLPASLRVTQGPREGYGTPSETLGRRRAAQWRSFVWIAQASALVAPTDAGAPGLSLARLEVALRRSQNQLDSCLERYVSEHPGALTERGFVMVELSVQGDRVADADARASSPDLAPAVDCAIANARRVTGFTVGDAQPRSVRRLLGVCPVAGG